MPRFDHLISNVFKSVFLKVVMLLGMCKVSACTWFYLVFAPGTRQKSCQFQAVENLLQIYLDVITLSPFKFPAYESTQLSGDVFECWIKKCGAENVTLPYMQNIARVAFLSHSAISARTNALSHDAKDKVV